MVIQKAPLSRGAFSIYITLTSISLAYDFCHSLRKHF